MAQAVTPIRPADTLRSRETPGDMVRRLEAEARDVARQTLADLKADLGDIAGRCLEISEMTSVKPGEREQMRRLAGAIEAALKTAQAIGGRS